MSLVFVVKFGEQHCAVLPNHFVLTDFLQPLSDVVDVDSLDLNGGLAHALSSRLQRIQANKSFPSELRMSGTFEFSVAKIIREG